jgi:hypothetical protein
MLVTRTSYLFATNFRDRNFSSDTWSVLDGGIFLDRIIAVNSDIAFGREIMFMRMATAGVQHRTSEKRMQQQNDAQGGANDSDHKGLSTNKSV